MNIKTANGRSVNTESSRTGGKRALTALLMASFAIYGNVMTIFGATLPRIIGDYGWSYTVTGLVLAASAVSFFPSTYPPQGTPRTTISSLAYCFS